MAMDILQKIVLVSLMAQDLQQAMEEVRQLQAAMVDDNRQGHRQHREDMADGNPLDRHLHLEATVGDPRQGHPQRLAATGPHHESLPRSHQCCLIGKSLLRHCLFSISMILR